MVTISILVGVVGTGALGSRMRLSQFERDVAFDGADDRLVPGTLEFSVLEPLDGGSAEMTVGVAVTSESAEDPSCSLSEADGGTVGLQRAAYDEQLLDMDGSHRGYTVVSIARLGAGDYQLTCEPTGELASSGPSFTAGRVIGVDDVTSMLGPFLWMLVLWSIVAVVFLIGVVLLIVGAVRRSRSNQAPMPGSSGHGTPVQGPFTHTADQPPSFGGHPGVGPPTAAGSGTDWGDPRVPQAPPTYPAPPASGVTSAPDLRPAPDAPVSPGTGPSTNPEGSVDGWTVPPSKK